MLVQSEEMGLLFGDSFVLFEPVHEMEHIMVRFQVVCFFPNELFLGGLLSTRKEPASYLAG